MQIAEYYQPHYQAPRRTPAVDAPLNAGRRGWGVTPAQAAREGDMIIHGDALETLRGMEPASVDALVTDPPAGIGFMGEAWDGHKGGRDAWIAWLRGILAECLRVMKPGAHGLVWALPRTSHWTGMACELAGFEVRDRVSHFFGQGFPKGGKVQGHPGSSSTLKPACEDWWLVRKPYKGSARACMDAHGTGALHVDACRPTGGRWPAHVVLDEGAARMLDEQSGFTVSSGGGGFRGAGSDTRPGLYGKFPARALPENVGKGDSGGASRFFYCAKASRSEREAGLESAQGERANTHPTVKPIALMRWLVRLITPPGGLVLDPFTGSGTTGVACMCEGLRFVGVEQHEEYCEIARARVAHHREKRAHG